MCVCVCVCVCVPVRSEMDGTYVCRVLAGTTTVSETKTDVIVYSKSVRESETKTDVIVYSICGHWRCTMVVWALALWWWCGHWRCGGGVDTGVVVVVWALALWVVVWTLALWWWCGHWRCGWWCVDTGVVVVVWTLALWWWCGHWRCGGKMVYIFHPAPPPHPPPHKNKTKNNNKKQPINHVKMTVYIIGLPPPPQVT